jgi:hypothetical protein
MVTRDDDTGNPCSRIPPELCAGARIILRDDGSSKREPMQTPRPFCDPCRGRILACLEELPPAYGRLLRALGQPPWAGPARSKIVFGPREPIRGEIDALMRVTAVILHGWEFRVRRSRLNLSLRPTPDILAPESVKAAAETLARHIDVLLALQPGWMTRTFTFPPGKLSSVAAQEGTCRRCGQRIARLIGGVRHRWYVTGPVSGPVGPCAHEPAEIIASRALGLIPAELEAEIADEEIVEIGDGWLKVTRHVGAAVAGNEILDLHWRARRHLGETRPGPEFFDGIPCKACDEMALERAEPPSNPDVPAAHSKCVLCKDEMSREEFDQWAEMYASWARGAGIQVCRRCTLAAKASEEARRMQLHAECCWSACTCSEAPHPRRPAAA